MREPLPVNAEGCGRYGIAEPNQAFARGGITRERRRGARRVRRFQIERDQSADRLRRDAGRVDTITGNLIAAGAVIAHRRRGEACCWIDTILQQESREAIRIVHSSRDGDGLISRG